MQTHKVESIIANGSCDVCINMLDIAVQLAAPRFCKPPKIAPADPAVAEKGFNAPVVAAGNIIPKPNKNPAIGHKITLILIICCKAK